MGVEDTAYVDRGTRWDFGPSDTQRFDGNATASGLVNYGHIIASNTPKTLIVPAGDGNAGDFSDNRFYLALHVGYVGTLRKLGKPLLLDQNIQPGTYTCTMILTAIPSII